MTSNRSFAIAILLVVLLPALPGSAQESQPLPEAPVPRQKAHSQPIHVPGATRYRPSKWDLGVDPGEKIPPLYPRDKMRYWLHEDIDPISWIPGLLGTGWEQLVDGNPNYGSDSAAFGERLGATVIRDTSMRFFANSLLPTLTHEDPRYYRKAYGGIRERAIYAVERVLVTQHDDGGHGFNYSDTLGHLAASALTPTYYPGPSSSTGVVMKTWVFSLAGDAGGKAFLEFWPDVSRLIEARRHRRKSEP